VEQGVISTTTILVPEGLSMQGRSEKLPLSFGIWSIQLVPAPSSSVESSPSRKKSDCYN
jgi:hypothetical protein